MINKINRIYSIFKEDVVLSNDCRINAIEGYNIFHQSNILTRDDVNNFFYNNGTTMSKIPSNEIWLFENPANEEQWYVGHNIIAWKKVANPTYDSYNEMTKPRIMVLYNNGKVLATSIDTVLDYSKVIGAVTSIALCYSIGFLSTPHSTFNNGGINIDTVKLPFVV